MVCNLCGPLLSDPKHSDFLKKLFFDLKNHFLVSQDKVISKKKVFTLGEATEWYTT